MNPRSLATACLVVLVAALPAVFADTVQELLLASAPADRACRSPAQAVPAGALAPGPGCRPAS